MRHSAIAATIGTALLSACAAGPHRIHLMPAPTVLAEGLFDPFADDEPRAGHGVPILFATDRARAEDTPHAYYDSRRGHVLRLGTAVVHLAADPPIEWERALDASLKRERDCVYPIEIDQVDELGVLDSSLWSHDAGAAYDPACIPAVIFTDPEIASVGLTSEEAKEQGFEPVEGKFPFAASGRALSINEAEGWVKVIGDAKTDKLLGVHMIGPEVTELIAEGALAIELGATVSDVAQTIHAHPTLPEGIMEASEAVHSMAVHIFQKPSAPKKPAPASV